MSDKPIDRDGVGKTLIRKLGEKTDTEGFRTTSIDTVEGRVTMRTKGGMPEVTREHSEETVKGFLPLKEIDANHPSGNTQDARLYYHDHEKDENLPPRYVTSADGIIAIRVKPLKKSLFRSLGLGKRVDIWLNDFSKPAQALKSVDYTAAGTPVAPQLSQEDEDAASSIVLMEALKRPEDSQGSPYKKDEFAFSDDPDGMLYRRFYRPELVIQPRPVDTNVDPGRQRGLAFLIARVKRLVFKVSGISGAKFMSFWFAQHNDATRTSKKADGATGECVERSIHQRPYDVPGTPGVIGNTNVPQYARSVSMVGGKISFAPPYGWMLPLHKEKGTDLIRPAEKCTLQNESGTYDIFSPLTSLSHLISFGQIWHGKLNSTTGVLHAESDGRVVATFTSDEIPSNDLGDICRFLYVNFSGKTGRTELPLNTVGTDETLSDVQYLTYDAVIVKDKYTFSEDADTLGLGDGGFLYRNSDGSVHVLRAYFNNRGEHVLEQSRELSIFGPPENPYPPMSQVVPVTYQDPKSFQLHLNASSFHVRPDGKEYACGGFLFRLFGDAGKDLAVECLGLTYKPFPKYYDTEIPTKSQAPYGTGFAYHVPPTYDSTPFFTDPMGVGLPSFAKNHIIGSTSATTHATITNEAPVGSGNYTPFSWTWTCDHKTYVNWERWFRFPDLQADNFTVRHLDDFYDVSTGKWGWIYVVETTGSTSKYSLNGGGSISRAGSTGEVAGQNLDDESFGDISYSRRVVSGIQLYINGASVDKRETSATLSRSGTYHLIGYHIGYDFPAAPGPQQTAEAQSDLLGRILGGFERGFPIGGNVTGTDTISTQYGWKEINPVTGSNRTWFGTGLLSAYVITTDGAPSGTLVCKGKVYTNLPFDTPLCYDPRTNNLFVDPDGAHLII